MSRLDYLVEQIQRLQPSDRATLDSALLGVITDDAENQRHQYELSLATDYLEAAKKLRAEWGQMQGISSGYDSIDELTKGFVPGEVTVIGGATSNGKTALAVNITARIAKLNIPVLFVTLEMTHAQLVSRLLFCEPEFENHASIVSLQKADEMNWQSIDGLISSAVKEMGVGLVVIDHLHYFTRELNNVSEDLGRITKEFKKNAIRHDVPIILISHTRKGSGNSLDDLRGSSYIAQDADVVLMVTRDSSLPRSIVVSCEKNRNRGYDFANNAVTLDFNQTRITEETDGEQMGIPWST